MSPTSSRTGREIPRRQDNRRRRFSTPDARLVIVLAVACACALPGCLWNSSDEGSPSAAFTGSVYEGAAFKVMLPAGFTVRPSLRSRSADGYDSAFFDSPDRRVVFYVFAPPRWREATDVDLNPARERLLSDQTMKSGGEGIQQLQIAALNSSYTRLVEKISSSATGTQWVFGYQYADSGTYDEYLEPYKGFKRSLEQFDK